MDPSSVPAAAPAVKAPEPPAAVAPSASNPSSLEELRSKPLGGADNPDLLKKDSTGPAGSEVLSKPLGVSNNFDSSMEAHRPVSGTELLSKPAGASEVLGLTEDSAAPANGTEAGSSLPKPTEPSASGALPVHGAPRPASSDGPTVTDGSGTATHVPEQSMAAPKTDDASNLTATKPTERPVEPTNVNDAPLEKAAAVGMPSSAIDSNSPSSTRNPLAAEPEASKASTVTAGSIPVGTEKREGAPLGNVEDKKPERKTEGDKKRKADELDNGGAVGQSPEVPGAASKKRKPGRPPAAANGDSTGKRESFGEKLSKKAKKVFHVGKTERKTRSQGPAA